MASHEEKHDATLRLMSDIERKAHAQIAKILWVIFPNDDNMNSEQGENIGDQKSAALIIDGLKRAGFTFYELDQKYVSPWSMTDEESEVFYAKLSAEFATKN